MRLVWLSLCAFLVACAAVERRRTDRSSTDCVERIRDALRTLADGSLARSIAQRCLKSTKEGSTGLLQALRNVYVEESRRLYSESGWMVKSELSTTPTILHRDFGKLCSVPQPFLADQWTSCCSSLDDDNGRHTNQHSISVDPFGQQQDTELCDTFCCELGLQSSAHLYLPLLSELSLSLHLELEGENRTFLIQQDGFLRPFDMSIVLWPTGYLLAQCLAHPMRCGLGSSLQQARSVIELGAGVGVPLLAAAFGEWDRLVAVDMSLPALALVHANFRHAGLAPPALWQRNVLTLCGGDDGEHVVEPFDVVLISSVPALFHDKNGSALLGILDCLLLSSGIAVIAHGVDALVHVPKNSSEGWQVTTLPLVARRLGVVGSRHREGGDDVDDLVDFEISVIRRSVTG